MKKTILHFIFDLGLGGAETLLVQVLKALKEYNNIVVTLYNNNHFNDKLECDELICLNQPRLLSFPSSARKLRNIVLSRKVDLVHTHLFWPMIIARLGVPKQIPLISTIHAFVLSSLEYKMWWVRAFDKYSFKKRESTIIAVAEGALKEYLQFQHIKNQRGYVLYTFADTAKFSQPKLPTGNDGTFRIASVGALRKQKNQQMMIRAMRLVSDPNISLDIYGSGPLEDELRALILKLDLKNVTLAGESEKIEHILPHYDLFMMSSLFEGFSIGVLEAMSIRLPLLLSNIDSFREQCDDCAAYFPLNDEKKLADMIVDAKRNTTDYALRADQAYNRVKENFSYEQHMKKLREIYLEHLEK